MVVAAVPFAVVNLTGHSDAQHYRICFPEPQCGTVFGIHKNLIMHAHLLSRHFFLTLIQRRVLFYWRSGCRSFLIVNYIMGID